MFEILDGWLEESWIEWSEKKNLKNDKEEGKRVKVRWNEALKEEGVESERG